MSAACVICGDGRRLRYDRDRGGFVCVCACGTTKPQKRTRRPALFNGWVDDNGLRRRATRDELREATRLYLEHADIREGRAHA